MIYSSVVLTACRWTPLFLVSNRRGTVCCPQFDIKNRRHFLKRIKYDGVTLQQLYIGSTIVVYARQLRLIEYGDDFTRQSIENRAEKTLALIKPDAVKHMGKIINAITTSGFSIT
eukprot:GHRQ01038195.1.p1 GENE.GHRQ01038195.1~~GHRQ01038195.1.p1  ORF type:complete len:115 (+),score=18.40 GHRQ01038195.1:887-1231(+)